MDCVFCNIVEGKVPSEIIYQNNEIIAFRDINPKAKVHILIVTKRHISSVNEVQEEDVPVLGKLFVAAKTIAKEQGIDKSGYRLLVNTGKDAGQLVQHLHMHVLGGEEVRNA